MKKNNFVKYSFALVASVSMLLAACKGGGVAPSLNALPTTPAPLPTNGTSSYALVYGASSSDRQNFADRIAGYQAPGLATVFNQWNRFSRDKIYAPGAATQVPAACYTGGLDTNYNWKPSTTDVSITNPGTDNKCINTDEFLANSWSYIASPDRIYNAANGSYLNGFVSSIKFEKYTIQATLSSTDSDNDGIGIVIAAVVDAGHVHTLSAMRTQGGWIPTEGWGIVYKRDDIVQQTFQAKVVGATTGAWSGKKTMVRVERDGDSIKAFTSLWGTGSGAQTLEPTSEIDLDLSNSGLNLGIFRGEQSYGYGTVSQVAATFSNITFTAPNSAADPTYIYDLANDQVYYKDSSAGYILVNGVSALATLGFPLKVVNNETSRSFQIDSATAYHEL